MKTLQLLIQTPAQQIFSGHCFKIIAQGEDGQLTVLPHHAHIASSLKIDELLIEVEGEREQHAENRYFALSGGIMLVENDLVHVMTGSAEEGAHIDVPRAQAAQKRAEERLNNPTDTIDKPRAEQAYWRACTRLAVAARYKKGA